MLLDRLLEAPRFADGGGRRFAVGVLRLAWAMRVVYWKSVAPVTIGVRGMVVDAEGRVLLVRHTYRPGWHFPGGGVARRESLAGALRRELREEAGVAFDGTPELIGVLDGTDENRSDHVLLYRVRTYSMMPHPNAEIAEARFVDPGALPEGTSLATRAHVHLAQD